MRSVGLFVLKCASSTSFATAAPKGTSTTDPRRLEVVLPDHLGLSHLAVWRFRLPQATSTPYKERNLPQKYNVLLYFTHFKADPFKANPSIRPGFSICTV